MRELRVGDRVKFTPMAWREAVSGDWDKGAVKFMQENIYTGAIIEKIECDTDYYLKGNNFAWEPHEIALMTEHVYFEEDLFEL